MTVSPLDLGRGLSRTFRTWLIILAAIVVALAIIALGANRPADPTQLSIPAPGATTGPNGEVAFALGQIQVGDQCKKVLVADTDAKRVLGLSGRRVVPEDGMLFVYLKDVHFDFTMAKTLIPLDIGFYDGNGRPVDRREMRPCPDGTPARCPKYHSRRKYRYALETGHGQLSGGALGACTV